MLKKIIYTIGLVSDTVEHAAAFSYIKEVYLDRFGTVPHESTIYIIAKKEGLIDGVVALDFANASGELPLEYLYKVHKSKVPPRYIDRSNSVQFGRWIARDSKVALALVYGAAVLGKKQGKESVWFVQKKAANKILNRYGVITRHIPATLQKKNIPPGDARYYLGKETPQCYVSSLEQMRLKLMNQVQRFLFDEDLTLDRSVL